MRRLHPNETELGSRSTGPHAAATRSHARRLDTTLRNGNQKTWRVRYITQDRGQQTEATGFVFLPDVDTSDEFPLLLYTHPLMGFSDACAPTAIGLEGAAVPLLMSAMGLVVAAPDYL